MKLLVPGAVIAAAAAVGACAGPRTTIAWSRAQAESITVVRGMPVHVVRCDGIGPAVQADQAPHYRRFACTAGARASFQTYDTIGVTYVLKPLGPFTGSSSRYVLTEVYFAALSIP